MPASALPLVWLRQNRTMVVSCGKSVHYGGFLVRSGCLGRLDLQVHIILYSEEHLLKSVNIYKFLTFIYVQCVHFFSQFDIIRFCLSIEDYTIKLIDYSEIYAYRKKKPQFLTSHDFFLLIFFFNSRPPYFYFHYIWSLIG